MGEHKNKDKTPQPETKPPPTIIQQGDKTMHGPYDTADFHTMHDTANRLKKILNDRSAAGYLFIGAIPSNAIETVLILKKTE